MVALSTAQDYNSVLLIEYNGKVSFEAPPVDGVHVVGGALVNASIHLSGRIDFNLGLDLVLSDAPFTSLKRIDLNNCLIVNFFPLPSCTRG